MGEKNDRMDINMATEADSMEPANPNYKMKYDPATGQTLQHQVVPDEYRIFNGAIAWAYNPFTGAKRDLRDAGTDPEGRLIIPPNAHLAVSARPHEDKASDTNMDHQHSPSSPLQASTATSQISSGALDLEAMFENDVAFVTIDIPGCGVLIAARYGGVPGAVVESTGVAVRLGRTNLKITDNTVELLPPVHPNFCWLMTSDGKPLSASEAARVVQMTEDHIRANMPRDVTITTYRKRS